MKKYTKKDYIKNNIDLSNIKTFDDFIVATVEGYVKNGNPIDKWMFEQYKSIIAFNAMKGLVNDTFELKNAICKKEDESYDAKNDNGSVKKESFFKRMFGFLKRK